MVGLIALVVLRIEFMDKDKKITNKNEILKKNAQIICTLIHFLSGRSKVSVSIQSSPRKGHTSIIIYVFFNKDKYFTYELNSCCDSMESESLHVPYLENKEFIHKLCKKVMKAYQDIIFRWFYDEFDSVFFKMSESDHPNPGAFNYNYSRGSD
jgi:hypothetical protein